MFGYDLVQCLPIGLIFMKLRFIICAPAYGHQSAGVTVLHSLCDRLNKLGYPAAIIFSGKTEPVTEPRLGNSFARI